MWYVPENNLKPVIGVCIKSLTQLIFLISLNIIFYFQSGQMDLKHFDPEFVREPVPGKEYVIGTGLTNGVEETTTFIGVWVSLILYAFANLALFKVVHKHTLFQHR